MAAAQRVRPRRRGGRAGPGGGRAEELEDIEVKEMALSELARRADLGSITDAKTMLLIQTLRLRRPNLFA